jgi:hypothetical protein
MTKFVRTGEGILVFAFNLAMIIVPIVSSALTPQQAVKWAAIINAVAVVSRTGLKVVSVVQSATDLPPAQVLNQTVTSDLTQLASEVAKMLPQDLNQRPSSGQVEQQLDQLLQTVQKLAADARHDPQGVPGPDEESTATRALEQAASATASSPAVAQRVEDLVPDQQEFAGAPSAQDVAASASGLTAPESALAGGRPPAATLGRGLAAPAGLLGGGANGAPR